MNSLLILLLLNSDTLKNTEPDSTSFLQRFLHNTEMSVNFNFHHSVRTKGNLDKIDPQTEFDNFSQENYSNVARFDDPYPYQICYAYNGGGRFSAGFLFSSKFRLKNLKPMFIYGINFSYEKHNYATTVELRKKVFDLYSAHMASQNWNNQTNLYVQDTSVVRKIDIEWAGIIPLAIRIPLKSKLSIETGGYIKLLKSEYEHKFSSNSQFTSIPKYGGLTFELNPYFALNFHVKKFLILQVGFDRARSLFLSIQI